MQSMGLAQFDDGHRGQGNATAAHQAASFINGNSRRRNVGQSQVLAQSRGQNAEAMGSSQATNISAIRRSQRVNVNKARPIQQSTFENTASIHFDESAAASANMNVQQMLTLQQQFHPRPSGAEDRRAFRRAHKGTAATQGAGAGAGRA